MIQKSIGGKNHGTLVQSDKINLVFPMKIQRIKGSDKIAATIGRVALRYGPLIYTAESVDQNLDNVLIIKIIDKLQDLNIFERR